MFDLLIRNCMIVNGGQKPILGSVAVKGEKITAILEPTTDLTAHVEIDGQGKVLFPGIIDPHVHYRYAYGYRSDRQDYLTETRSALIGGVTTAIRMHRELTPFSENIPAEIEMIESQSHIDIAFHLALMTEDQLSTFPRFSDEYGINSFKLYLAYKGKAGQLQGLQGADDGFLYEAMRRIGQYETGIACVHAENSEIADRIGNRLRESGCNGLSSWAEARPGWSEAEAIHRAGYIAFHANCPIYIVHITSAEGIRAIEDLRRNGMPVHAEVCMQHLTLTSESQLGALAKVNPPLRSEEHVEALWDAVSRGVVDTIATDHVAHTTAKMKGSIWDVMPGFSGSATMLPALLTFGYHTGRLTLSEIASLVSSNAARIFGLRGKGEIAIGAHADFVLVDLEKEIKVEASYLRSGSDYSIYDGQTLRGWPTFAILRGQVAMADGEIHVPTGYGKYFLRG